MNILLTLDRNYLNVAEVMLSSLFRYNDEEEINLYILSKDLKEEDFRFLPLNVVIINPELDLSGAATSKRYPDEIYFRLFAFALLPDNVEKVLYLDPDIIVNKNLRALYDIDLKDNYVAGCTHINKTLTAFNSRRMGENKVKSYLNTGVLLFNLSLIRRDFSREEIIKTIKENRARLMLPDQDIMVLLFKNRVLILDTLVYNLSDRIFELERIRGKRFLNLEWVKENTAIIHYCGRNKPWKESYVGKLGEFYDREKTLFENRKQEKLNID